ncbi:flagellar biosynthetic protein FliO [Lysobacter firmicutimachus]|uniref:Flagellar biosynthetic protein FliO n=1 Tax=Lysobacter firmicutimachus TaxID=1792846 RepID=A0AAU8MXQ2_9GAMM|nr:flagellar biosynthetic protein FliO [Lysobacter antibioticus]
MPIPFLLRPLLRLGFAAAVWPWSAALAAPAAKPAAAAAEPPSFFFELLSIMLPVAVVLVGLIAVLYYLRKRHGLVARDAPLTIVQVLPVGPRERIVVLRTRSGRALAVGVGGQSPSLIAELDAADIAPAPAEDGAGQAPERSLAQTPPAAAGES